MAGADLEGEDEVKEAFRSQSRHYTPSTEGFVVGSNVPYALHQEFGTYEQPGTPHVRPGTAAVRAQMGAIAAVASNMDEYLQMLADALVAEIQRRAPVLTGRLRASYSPPVEL